MSDDFSITGCFYEKNGEKFRKYLNIKIKNTETINKPDLMVIMMNPGASEPVDGNDDGRKEVETIPDNTQYHIIEVMKHCNFNYARVINLSDLREADSKKFLPKIESLGKTYSIFSRKNDFNNLFEPNVPVICAWGVDEKLEPLIEEAISKMNSIIGNSKRIGWLKEDNYYYHSSRKKKNEWEDEVTKQLKNNGAC